VVAPSRSGADDLATGRPQSGLSLQSLPIFFQDFCFAVFVIALSDPMS
jgi:hypothetical protein